MQLFKAYNPVYNNNYIILLLSLYLFHYIIVKACGGSGGDSFSTLACCHVSETSSVLFLDFFLSIFIYFCLLCQIGFLSGCLSGFKYYLIIHRNLSFFVAKLHQIIHIFYVCKIIFIKKIFLLNLFYAIIYLFGQRVFFLTI